MRCLSTSSPHTNSNCFINMEPVYTLEALSFIDNSTFIDSFFPSTFNSFLNFADSVKLYEDSRCTYVSKKHRYFIHYEVLLPKKCRKSQKKIKKIFYRLRKTICGDLSFPYYACVIKKGTASYLNFLIYEREYFAEKQLVCTYASSDRYRSLKSGKCCKKDDKDSVCFMKRGDIISQSYEHYNKKDTRFTFVNKKDFTLHINALKVALVAVIDSLIGIKRGFSFKRISKDVFQDRPWQCSLIQRTMKKLERLIEASILQYQLGYLDNTDIVQEIKALGHKYQSRFNQGAFKYGSLTLRLEPTLNYQQLKDNLRTLYKCFEIDLHHVSLTLFGFN